LARIVLVDDHRIFREGVAALIARSEEDTLVASLPDCDALERAILEQKADLVVLDLALDTGRTFHQIGRIKRRHPRVRVLILSMHGDQGSVERALQSGADGYTLKQDAFDDLLFAIRAIERGGRFVSPTIMRQGDIAIVMDKPDPDAMPERQRQILQLLAEGKANKQIAAELGIALSTVKNHLNTLFRKYRVTNRVGLLNRLDMIGDAEKY